MVATELLGKSAGVISGCALIVDYILTITVSIAGGGDALFSLLPYSLYHLKLPVEFAAILFLIVMNLRGIKESVTVLVPIFLTFVVTHVFLIIGGIFIHLPEVSSVVREVHHGFQSGLTQLGGWGLFLVFLHAYSLGGGTYTGYVSRFHRNILSVRFFCGRVGVCKPQWYHRILHNETAYAILRRIKFAGLPMVILPIRIHS